MSIIKRLGRQIVFPTVVFLGIEKIFSRLSPNNLLILNYHGVVKKYNPAFSPNHISVDQFEDHLKYFKSNFDVITISDAFKYNRNNTRPEKRSVVITFDDGYENNFTNALPLLKAHSFPATFFVTAGIFEGSGKTLWYDQLDLLKTKVEFSEFKKSIGKEYPAMLSLNSFAELKNHFKTINGKTKEFLLGLIRSNDNLNQSIYSCDPEYWKMMTKEQLVNLSKSDGMEIGAHSVSHSNLDTLNADDLEYELKESKSILENIIQKKIDSIAFPDGAYNELVKKVSLEIGYNKLLAVDYRLHDEKIDTNILPRFSISNTTTFESVMITLNRSFSSLGF